MEVRRSSATAARAAFFRGRWSICGCARVRQTRSARERQAGMMDDADQAVRTSAAPASPAALVAGMPGRCARERQAGICWAACARGIRRRAPWRRPSPVRRQHRSGNASGDVYARAQPTRNSPQTSPPHHTAPGIPTSPQPRTLVIPACPQDMVHACRAFVATVYGFAVFTAASQAAMAVRHRSMSAASASGAASTAPSPPATRAWIMRSTSARSLPTASTCACAGGRSRGRPCKSRSG